MPVLILPMDNRPRGIIEWLERIVLMMGLLTSLLLVSGAVYEVSEFFRHLSPAVTNVLWICAIVVALALQWFFFGWGMALAMGLSGAVLWVILSWMGK